MQGVNPFTAAVQRATENMPDDGHREPTEFEKAVLNGLQRKHVYQGYRADQHIVHPDGTTEIVPDPRIGQCARRRARNKTARRQRRINRVRAAR